MGVLGADLGGSTLKTRIPFRGRCEDVAMDPWSKSPRPLDFGFQFDFGQPRRSLVAFRLTGVDQAGIIAAEKVDTVLGVATSAITLKRRYSPGATVERKAKPLEVLVVLWRWQTQGNARHTPYSTLAQDYEEDMGGRIAFGLHRPILNYYYATRPIKNSHCRTAARARVDVSEGELAVAGRK